MLAVLTSTPSTSCSLRGRSVSTCWWRATRRSSSSALTLCSERRWDDLQGVGVHVLAIMMMLQVMFLIATAACALVILSLVHFLMALSANYAHIRGHDKFTDLVVSISSSQNISFMLSTCQDLHNLDVTSESVQLTELDNNKYAAHQHMGHIQEYTM